jgi:AcrR family transcriptional regulator
MRATSTSEANGSTKDRILVSATRLFAEHGLDAVPLRDIAVDANVNGASINYHFGSKERLIREVYRRLFSGLNKLRIQALDDCEVAARGKKLEPREIMHALVEPMVSFSTSTEGGGVYLVRLIFHAYGVQRNFVDESIAEQVDHIAHRFHDALEKALPNVSPEDLYWRFDFAIGASLHILIDTQRGHRLNRLSGGLCDTDDNARMIEQLIASLTASFIAPSVGPAKIRRKSKTAPGRRR